MKVQKINQCFKLIIKGVIMYELVFALLVKMQIDLACENCKENKENTKC